MNIIFYLKSKFMEDLQIMKSAYKAKFGFESAKEQN